MKRLVVWVHAVGLCLPMAGQSFSFLARTRMDMKVREDKQSKWMLEFAPAGTLGVHTIHAMSGRKLATMQFQPFPGMPAKGPTSAPTGPILHELRAVVDLDTGDRWSMDVSDCTFDKVSLAEAKAHPMYREGMAILQKENVAWSQVEQTGQLPGSPDLAWAGDSIDNNRGRKPVRLSVWLGAENPGWVEFTRAAREAMEKDMPPGSLLPQLIVEGGTFDPSFQMSVHRMLLTLPRPPKRILLQIFTPLQKGSIWQTNPEQDIRIVTEFSDFRNAFDERLLQIPMNYRRQKLE